MPISFIELLVTFAQNMQIVHGTGSPILYKPKYVGLACWKLLTASLLQLEEVLLGLMDNIRPDRKITTLRPNRAASISFYGIARGAVAPARRCELRKVVARVL